MSYMERISAAPDTFGRSVFDSLVADGMLEEIDWEGDWNFVFTERAARLMDQHSFPATEEGLGSFLGFLIHMRLRDHHIAQRMARRR